MTNEVDAGAMLTPIPWPTPSDQDRAMAEEMTNLSFLAMDDETYLMMARAIAVGRSITEARAIRAEKDRDIALRECSKWAAEAGEAKGRLEASEMAGVVDGWRERAMRAEDALKPFAAMPLSTETEASDLLHRSPAEEMRRHAAATEQRDAQILAAKSALTSAGVK